MYHYAVAAATQAGSEAQGGYQYPGKTYVGRFEHVEDSQHLHAVPRCAQHRARCRYL
jgi:hypothetical protein